MQGSYTFRYSPILPRYQTRMATPDTWLLSDAVERVRAATPAWLDSHRLFAEGDHLQIGGGVSSIPGLVRGALAGWIAPMPPPQYQHYQNHVDGVIRGFVSANKIGEVRWRHTAGVVGRQPSKGFESREAIPEGKEMAPELRRLKEEADAWMSARWEAEGMHGSLQKGISALLVAGRQPARMLLPSAYMVEGKRGVRRLPNGMVEDFTKMLRLTYPTPETCTVWTDPDTFEQVGIFTYKQDEEDRAEVTWVDRASGLTHVRVIGSTSGTIMEPVYDFGGLIPMFEMRRDVFVTPQMVQNNKALNLALSSVPANVYTAMMRTRTFLNVDPPGKDVVIDGEKIFVPDDLQFGRAIANFMQGSPIYDKDTRDKEGELVPVDYASPAMQTEEPVEVRPSREAVEIHEYQILAEGRQLHVLRGADAIASGVSIIVARTEFMGSLQETKPTADACIEWQMDVRLAMSEAFSSGREGVKIERTYSANLRASAECKLDPGPVTPEELKALDALGTSGRLSDTTTLGRMGVEDVKEEQARKAAENRTKTTFALIADADNAGIDRYAVLTILGGFTPEEAKALARGDVTAGGITQ